VISGRMYRYCFLNLFNFILSTAQCVVIGLVYNSLIIPGPIQELSCLCTHQESSSSTQCFV
jgi:hypothetical protein